MNRRNAKRSKTIADLHLAARIYNAERDHLGHTKPSINGQAVSGHRSSEPSFTDEERAIAANVSKAMTRLRGRDHHAWAAIKCEYYDLKCPEEELERYL